MPRKNARPAAKKRAERLKKKIKDKKTRKPTRGAIIGHAPNSSLALVAMLSALNTGEK